MVRRHQRSHKTRWTFLYLYIFIRISSNFLSHTQKHLKKVISNIDFNPGLRNT